jgi:hypothetical protein
MPSRSRSRSSYAEREQPIDLVVSALRQRVPDARVVTGSVKV